MLRASFPPAVSFAQQMDRGNLGQNDDMLEDGNAQPRGQVMNPREHGQTATSECGPRSTTCIPKSAGSCGCREQKTRESGKPRWGKCLSPAEENPPTSDPTIPTATSIGNDPGKPKRCYAPTCPKRPIGSDKR